MKIMALNHEKAALLHDKTVQNWPKTDCEIPIGLIVWVQVIFGHRTIQGGPERMSLSQFLV